MKLLEPYPPTQENKLVNSEEEWENHLEGTRQNYSVTSGEGGDSLRALGEKSPSGKISKNREGRLFTKNTGVSTDESLSIGSEVCPVQVSER